MYSNLPPPKYIDQKKSSKKPKRKRKTDRKQQDHDTSFDKRTPVQIAMANLRARASGEIPEVLDRFDIAWRNASKRGATSATGQDSGSKYGPSSSSQNQPKAKRRRHQQSQQRKKGGRSRSKFQEGVDYTTYRFLYNPSTGQWERVNQDYFFEEQDRRKEQSSSRNRETKQSSSSSSSSPSSNAAPVIFEPIRDFGDPLQSKYDMRNCPAPVDVELDHITLAILLQWVITNTTSPSEDQDGESSNTTLSSTTTARSSTTSSTTSSPSRPPVLHLSGRHRNLRALFLPPSAALADIRRRFRKLALRVHPDKVPVEYVDQANTAFRQLNNAHEELLG